MKCSVAICFALLSPSTLLAHDFSPSLVRLLEVSQDEYLVAVKSTKAIEITWPQSCVFRASTDVAPSLRGTLSCSEMGLRGKKIDVRSSDSFREVILDVDYLGGETLLRTLRGAGIVFEIPPERSWLGVSKDYFTLGIEHIWSGIDHLLFVLGLLLIVRSLPQLVVTVTAFTIGHAMTLTAAFLGWVHLSAAPVEATIALSLVFLALEVGRPMRDTLVHRRPWVVAMGFGLVHGLGFAGALSEIGVPANKLLLALASFNIGIEAGQALFVLVVAGVLLGVASQWPRKVMQYCIGSMGGFLVVSRVAEILS